jgi:hypothetical protein
MSVLITLLVWPLIPFFSNSRKVVWVEGYTLPGRLEELDVFEAQLVFAIFAEIKLNIQLALGFRFVTQGFLGDVSEALTVASPQLSVPRPVTPDVFSNGYAKWILAPPDARKACIPP